MAGERTVTVKFLGDTKDLSAATQSAGGALGKLGGALGDIGKMAAGFAIGEGLTKLPGLFSGFLSSASDMNESLSKVGVVFGSSAGDIETFANSAATNLGITKQAALEAAGTFGNLFLALGLGQEPAAEMSENILTLSADLASFNNMDPTEVLEKLRSGLVGEAEPLRSLGVNINAATVEAKAMELGLAGANGELSEAAKVQARYALILEQTTTAQGDFARTANGNANQLRILKAQLGDLSAELGAVLLPIAVKLGAVMIEHVVPALKTVAGFVTILGTAIKIAFGEPVEPGGFVATLPDWAAKTASALRATVDVVTAVGRTLIDLGTAVAGAVGTVMGPVSAVFDVIAGFVGAHIGDVVGALVDVGRGIAEIAEGAARFAAAHVGDVVDFFVKVGQAIADLAADKFGRIAEGLAKAAVAVADFAQAHVGDVVDAFVNLGGAVKDLAVAGWERIAGPLAEFGAAVDGISLETFVTALGNVRDALQPLYDLFAPLVQDIFAELVEAVGPIGEAFANLGKSFLPLVQALAPLLPILGQVAIILGATLVAALYAVLQAVKLLVPILGAAIAGAINLLAFAIENILVPAITVAVGIIGGLVTAIGAVITFVQNNWGTIQSIIEPVMTAVGTIVSTTFATIQTIIETVIGVISGIVDIFVGTFTGDWGRVKDGVIGVVTSLKDGVVGLITNMITMVGELAGTAWNALHGVGSEMMSGLMDALEGGAKAAGNVVIGILNRIIGAINSIHIPGISIPGWVPGVGGKGWDGWSPSVPTIPALAAGGIVTRPTIALIGEAGPEAVIPLSRGRGRGPAAGMTVVNHFHGDIIATDEGAARRAGSWAGYGIARSLRSRGYP